MSDAGVEIPYKDEGGAVVSVQRRHKLEKGKKKDNRFTWRKGDKILPYGLWMLPASRATGDLSLSKALLTSMYWSIAGSQP